MESQDPLEDQDGTAFLDCQVRKETWVLWDLQDLLVDQEAQEGPVLPDLKVNLDSQVEMGDQEVLVVKERGETLVSRVPQEPVCRQQSQREPKEMLDYQVHQVFQVRKASVVFLVTLDFLGQTDALESPDHQVLKEILESQEVQGVLEVQD